jgi:hypothetical protein
VTFAATSSGKTITSGGKNFYNVTWNGSGGGWTLGDNFSLSNAHYFLAGTLSCSTYTYTSSVGQYITIESGFTLNIGSGSFSNHYGSVTIVTGATVTISTGGFYFLGLTVSGTGTLNITGAATLDNYAGGVNISSPNFSAGTSTLTSYRYSTTPFTISSTQPLYNYRIQGSSTTRVSLASDLTVQNNFTISSNGGSFSAGTYTISVGGNFANGDTFTAGTSTVNFNDATKTSTISGNTTFNNLISSTSDKTIKFAAGSTQTVSSLSLTGTASHLITIDTDTGASSFNLSDTTGTNTLYYTSVTRSAAAGGATWNALVSDGNTNGGSNSGWNF